MNTSQLNSETPPKCDVMFAFLNAISHAISNSGLSRTMIIDRMNDAIGGEIAVTPDKFNKWLAPSSDRHFPMMYLPALCWALRDTSVADALLHPIEFKTVDQRGQMLKLAAEYELESKKFQAKRDSILSQYKVEA